VKFNEFNLSADLLAEIEKAGFVEASPIQEQTIPLALSITFLSSSFFLVSSTSILKSSYNL